MAQITKDMTFGELLSKYYSTCPKLVDDLMEAGMEIGRASCRERV